MIQHQPWNQTRKKIDLETKYGDPSTVGYGYQSLLVALCTLVIYGHLIACIYNSKEAEVSNKKYVPRRQLFSCRYLGTIPCSAHAFVSSILNEMPSYHSLLLICPETMDPESVSHLPNNCLICKLRGEISSLGLCCIPGVWLSYLKIRHWFIVQSPISFFSFLYFIVLWKP